MRPAARYPSQPTAPRKAAGFQSVALALALGACLPQGASWLAPRPGGLGAVPAAPASGPAGSAAARQELPVGEAGQPDELGAAGERESGGAETEPPATDSAAGAAAAEVPGEPPPAPPAPARPTPRRPYAIPVARAGGAFGPQVLRWQPVVDAELAGLRRWRRLDPSITTPLVLAIIAAESNGDPFAVSPANAIGLMQVLPSTFSDLFGDADPFDPYLNVRAGLTYLDLALRRHGGDLEWALAGYNAGIAASQQMRAGELDVYEETRDYVTHVMTLLSRAGPAPRWTGPPPAGNVPLGQLPGAFGPARPAAASPTALTAPAAPAVPPAGPDPIASDPASPGDDGGAPAGPAAPPAAPAAPPAAALPAEAPGAGGGTTGPAAAAPAAAGVAAATPAAPPSSTAGAPPGSVTPAAPAATATPPGTAAPESSPGAPAPVGAAGAAGTPSAGTTPTAGPPPAPPPPTPGAPPAATPTSPPAPPATATRSPTATGPNRGE